MSTPEGDLQSELDRAHRQIEQAYSEWIAALDAIDDPVFIHDKDFRIVRANRAYQRCTGIPFKALIGRPYYEVFPKNDGPLPCCLHAIETGEDAAEEEVTYAGRVYRSRASPVRDAAGGYLYSVHIMEDVTERKQAEQELQRANRALRIISAGNQALIHATDEDSLLQEMCEVAVKVGGYRLAWIGYAHDDAGKTIQLMAQAGLQKDWPNPSPLTWSEERYASCPAGHSIISRAPVIVQDIQRDTALQSWHENARQYGYASCIALPLMDGNHPFATLVLFDEKMDAFDPNEIELLEEMGGDLAFSILTLRVKAAHREHEQRLRRNMLQTVEAIVGIVEMRDPYTSGHQRRVAELARAIAGQMGLSDEEQQAIHLAGLVHDLGKIRVPAEILSKPGRLNEIEYGLIKVHPQAGYDILKGIDFFWPIAQMVLQHHERIDGSGYPLGLKGDAILLGARILCVADVVEAMSSHRPYRAGLGMESALSEITSGCGNLYDEKVVDACVTLFREKGYEFPQ